MYANTHTKQQRMERIQKFLIEHGEELLWKRALSCIMDTGFALEAVAYFLTHASGDSQITMAPFPPVDPVYSKMTFTDLERRLGQYIVALNEVQRLPKTVGVLRARQVLGAQINKMEAEVRLRYQLGQVPARATR